MRLKKLLHGAKNLLTYNFTGVKASDRYQAISSTGHYVFSHWCHMSIAFIIIIVSIHFFSRGILSPKTVNRNETSVLKPFIVFIFKSNS